MSISAVRTRMEREGNCMEKKGGGGWLRGLAEGGVSDITLMNQCQWSDEKIIKKQASTVLNTAKGKRPIPLYRNTIWTEKKNGNRWDRGKWGREIHIITDAKMPFRWHYERGTI